VERPNWDEYFMKIAEDVATRATCSRAAVGAVLVKDYRIISTGYNGAPAGEPHCMEEGCVMENGHCTRAVHAEVNAVCQAARFGVSTEGAKMYVYGLERPFACHNCKQVMKSAGVAFLIENLAGLLGSTKL